MRPGIDLGIPVEQVKAMHEVGLFKQMEERVSPELGALEVVKSEVQGRKTACFDGAKFHLAL